MIILSVIMPKRFTVCFKKWIILCKIHVGIFNSITKFKICKCK